MSQDDPKKQQAAPTPTTNPALDELTDEEYQQQYEASLKGAEGKPEQEKPSPVKSWWEKINGVMSKERKFSDIGRSAVRGVANAGVGLVQTISEGAAAVDRHTGLGEKLSPGFNEAYDRMGGARGVASEFAQPTKDKIDQTLGKRSDDGLASFTEGATQFITGMAAFNTGILKGAGALKGLAKGALTDASMFDPYEAQLAELAARSGVPGLKQLGSALSVEGDDGPAVARAKRAAAGAIPGVIFDGLVAVGRSLKAGKVLAKGATGAEKKAAEETLAENTKVLNDIEQGTHVPEDSHVTVTREDDGTFSVEHADGGNALEGVAGSNKLTFADEAEALQQAESASNTIQAKLDAGDTSFDPDEVVKAITEGDPTDAPIKASPYNTVEQDLELVKKLSDTIIEKRSAIEATTGGSITIEEGKQLAKETLEQIPEDQLHETIKGLLRANPESQDIASVAARMVLGQKGRNIVKLHDVLEARPHDPAAMDQLKQSIVNYFDLRDSLHPGESAGARRLRFVQENADFEKTSFETADQVAAQKAAQKEAADAIDEALAKIKTNKTDTDAATPKSLTGGDAVSATDFSLARERKRIKAALEKLQKGDQQFEHDTPTALERTNKIREEADAQRADPLTMTAAEKEAAKKVKTGTKNPIEELSRWLDSSDEGLDRDLAKASEVLTSAREDIAKLQERAVKRRADNPVGSFVKDAPHVKKEPASVAGMKTRDASQMALDDQNARVIARMFKMTNGTPVDVDAVLRGATVIQKGGKLRAALEVFTNSLLSGPPTWATVITSGQAISLMEPVVKMAAGAAQGNRALIREGADTLFGLYSHVTDNVKIAAMAMRKGQSIINPAPMTYAIGGATGKIIRAPGNIMLGLDEFTRVSNYRAYIRAKSLRAGREAGLEGAALAKRVDDDLRAAFDPNTGIATVPQALKYADVATLSSGLQPGFGRAMQEFSNSASLVKFVVPFVRATTNIWNYAFDSTPLLNLAFKRNRDILREGGEAAAQLHARTALATAVGTFAFLQAAQGNLTGKGPSDPELRKAWLKDNQPYSIRVGNTWVSYNRMDPLATPLGVMADLHTFAQELGDDHIDFEHGVYASLGAIAANMGAKTYMRGIFDLAEAWSKGDATSVGQYLQRQLPNFVPYGNLMARTNPDPYYREVDSMLDAVKSRMPYFSTTLDARHNIFGEKILKAEGIVNRSVNPFTMKEATTSTVEQELLSIGKSLAPASDKLYGMIDLHSKDFNEDANQPSPYTRMMELVRNPGHGLPSLRGAMEERIKRSDWKTLSDGTDDFKGGRKLAILAGIKERYESRALQQVKLEYPKLAKQITAVIRARGAAMRGGEEAQQAQEILTGPIRR